MFAHRLPKVVAPKLLDLVVSDVPVVGGRFAVCGFCGESEFHHYTCPIASESRRQDRISSYNLKHEYITYEPEDMI